MHHAQKARKSESPDLILPWSSCVKSQTVIKFIFLYPFFSFQEIIKTFKITRPMIPPHPNANQGNAAGPGNRGNQNEDDDE